MAVLNDAKLGCAGSAMSWCACAFAIAVALETACADPPPDLQAGRLLTLPGDAAGAALVAIDANVPPPPDAGSPANETSEGDASSAD